VNRTRVKPYRTLPWWVLEGGYPGSGVVPPPVPNPTDKTGCIWGYDLRTGATLSGSNVTALADASGGSNGSSFASGKETTYVASYGTTGKPWMTHGAASLGTFATSTNLIASGTAFSVFILLQANFTSSPQYRCAFSLKTATGSVNMNMVASNDSAYGFFANIMPTPNTFVVGNNSIDVATAPVAIIWNYNGGNIALSTSYSMRLNNSPVTLTLQTGTAGNNANANQINSYANTSPPAFPFTGGATGGLWLFNSVISSTEADTIFKPFAQSYNITQA
jgi:hypothetical protein